MNDNQTLKQFQKELTKKRQAAERIIAEAHRAAEIKIAAAQRAEEQKVTIAQREIDEINDIERRLSALIPVDAPKMEPTPEPVPETKTEVELPGSFNVACGVKGCLPKEPEPLGDVGVRT